MNGDGRASSEDGRERAIRRSDRGADAFDNALRHSRRVRILKIALPIVAVVVSGLFFGYSFLSSAGGGSVDISNASIEDGNLVMANPTLNGFTGENLPYTLTAARLRQPIGEDVGYLEDIHAEVPLEEGEEATITAATGRVNRQEGLLTFDSPVTLESTSGLVARLQSARVKIKSRELVTDDPVEIETGGMRIRADTFRATNGGKTLTFEDQVRVEINPSQIRSSEEREGEG